MYKTCEQQEEVCRYVRLQQRAGAVDLSTETLCGEAENCSRDLKTDIREREADVSQAWIIKSGGTGLGSF